MLRLVAIVACAITSLVSAQISSIQPWPPRAGESLTVRYDPTAAGAQLVASSACYASVSYYTASGTIIHWGKLEPRGDGAWTWTDPSPPDATSASVRFLSVDRAHPSDTAATLNLVAERASRHGIAPGMQADEIDARFRAWRSEHPDDWTVVFERWMALESAETAERLSERITLEVAELDAAATPGDAVLGFARVEARLRLGRDAEAISVARELVERLPADPWTARAVARLLPRVSAEGSNTANRDAYRELLRRFALLAPGSSFFRGDVLSALARDKDMPLDAVDRCADAWADAQPGDARPFLLQASARIERDVEAERADSLLSRALESAFGVAHRAYADPDGMATAALIRDVLLLRAKLATKRNDGAAALLFALAAKGAAQGMETDPSPDIASALGEGWRLLGGAVAATAATVAAPATEAVTIGGAEGAAPEFALKDLDGNDVTLSGLRGKVVVLNFWFVDCSPCKFEMPTLNQLAQRYTDKDVVFLAPALDAADRCREFLAGGEFRYRVLPNASPATSAYHVKAFPTHVVIDRGGKVALLRVGAGETLLGDLTAAIETALEAQ